MIDIKKQLKEDYTEDVAKRISEDVSPLKKEDYIMKR